MEVVSLEESDDAELAKHEACLRTGCYDLLVAGLADGSWSMARIPALRSVETTRGLPGLTKSQQSQVEAENKRLKAVLRCAWAADGGGGGVEGEQYRRRISPGGCRISSGAGNLAGRSSSWTSAGLGVSIAQQLGCGVTTDGWGVVPGSASAEPHIQLLGEESRLEACG